MRKFSLALAAAAMVAPTLVVSTPAEAQRSRGYYDRNGYYHGPTWRGRDGRYRCTKSDGTTGILIGGAAGALIGNQVAGRGSHGLGTVLGAAAGALAGRQIDRADSGYRDRNGRRCR